MGEDRLAGPGLSLDEQRTFERDRGVDRDLKILRSYVGVGALETSHARPIPRNCISRHARNDITRALP